MTKVTARLGLTLVNHFGLVEHIAGDPDVVLLPHSLLSPSALTDLRDRPYRAIRMIRDPRDIWVSGYLYHQHCAEQWCTNADLNPTAPIGWPQVDFSFAHRPEGWKRRYLERLNGKSYQQNLLDLEVAGGLDFELAGYTSCTFAAMREWASYGLQVMDVKLEAVMANFDDAMLRIFDHFGFTVAQSLTALEVARSEDVRRMDEAALAMRPQVHSRVISKWHDFLSADQVAEFEADHGDLVRELGYEPAVMASDPAGPLSDQDCIGRSDEAARGTPLAADPRPATDGLFAGDVTLEADVQFCAEPDEIRLIWPQFDQSPEPNGTATTIPAGTDVWLVADGNAIRPMISGQGIYRFVVPPGAERIHLESRRNFVTDPCAPYLGSSRCLGIRVSAISIRSRTGEVVIPADDPRLITGWHEVEYAGLGLWRWTDGSAELPWAGVSGPAVVTVRCQPLGEPSGPRELQAPA